MVVIAKKILELESFYGIQYGDYNLSLYPADTLDHKTGKYYHQLIIDRFDGNKNVECKRFYLEKGKRIVIESVNDVEDIFKNRKNSIL